MHEIRILLIYQIHLHYNFYFVEFIAFIIAFIDITYYDKMIEVDSPNYFQNVNACGQSVLCTNSSSNVISFRVGTNFF